MVRALSQAALGLLFSVLSSFAFAVLTIEICGSSASVGDGSCKDSGFWMGDAATGTFGAAGSVIARDGADAVKIPINPNATLATPPGWSSPSNPPATAASSTQYTCPSGFVSGPCASLYATKLEAASAFCTLQGHPTGPAVDVNNKITCENGAYGGGSSFFVGSMAGCPAGYTLSAGVCNLSNASLVPKPSDNVVGVTRTGNSYALDSVDPDTASGATAATRLAVSCSGGVCTAGYPALGRTVTVTINADGSTTITQAARTAAGNTEVTQVLASVPAAGTGATVEVGYGQKLMYGTGDLRSDTIAATGTSGDSCPLCARESTLLGIKATTDAIAANGVKVNESSADWAASRSSATSAQASTDAALQAVVDRATASTSNGLASSLSPGLSDPVLPTVVPAAGSSWLSSWIPTSTSCVDPDFGGTGRFAGMTFKMCGVLNMGRLILEWGLWLLTILVLYQSWSSMARSGSSGGVYRSGY